MEKEWEFVFVVNEKRYVARIYRDDCQRPPWENSDGHGVIELRRNITAEARANPKLHGLRPLGARHYYCFDASVEKAIKEGWGPKVDGETAVKAATRAVEADYKYLKDFVAGNWYYVGVSVMQLNNAGMLPKDDFSNALWGLASNDVGYIMEVARDLI